MNKFRKYCPNVFVAECDDKYEKGDTIEITTKYGKKVECEVFNYLGEYQGKHLYSIVRLEEKTYAERKAEKYRNASQKNIDKSKGKWEASKEGQEFLSLGEPIKVGHHSEKRHRALLERNWNRVGKAIELEEKAKEQERKVKYWEDKANKITLAMPESLEYFEYELHKAQEHHQYLKDNPEKRSHSFDLTYAKKAVNDLKKKVDIAKKLWGEEDEEVEQSSV